MSPTVLVVTVSFNSGQTLKAFLASLDGASRNPVEIVVVDNASTDLALERQLCDEYGARLLELSENRGYGAGISAGVNASQHTDYVLIVNPDVTFTPGAIDVLIDAADNDPLIGSVGPRIVDADGHHYPSARNLPSLRTGIGHALLARIWPRNPWTRRYRAELDDDGQSTRDAGWLSGACLLVRRSAYDQIGGFDPRFFMYFEDVDLGARLAESGWRNRYVAGATVAHTGAHSTSKRAKEMTAAHHDSAYLYLSRKYSAWYLFPLRWLLRFGLGARKRWITRDSNLSDTVRQAE